MSLYPTVSPCKCSSFFTPIPSLIKGLHPYMIVVSAPASRLLNSGTLHPGFLDLHSTSSLVFLIGPLSEFFLQFHLVDPSDPRLVFFGSSHRVIPDVFMAFVWDRRGMLSCLLCLALSATLRDLAFFFAFSHQGRDFCLPSLGLPELGLLRPLPRHFPPSFLKLFFLLSKEPPLTLVHEGAVPILLPGPNVFFALLFVRRRFWPPSPSCECSR